MPSLPRKKEQKLSIDAQTQQGPGAEKPIELNLGNSEVIHTCQFWFADGTKCGKYAFTQYDNRFGYRCETHKPSFSDAGAAGDLPPIDFQIEHPYGISPSEAEGLFSWIQDRRALVLGRDGRGGSGVYVRTRLGKLAVLTSKHVLIRCIITGEVTVGRPTQPGKKTALPLEIWADGVTDSALLFVNEHEHSGESLEFKDWTTSAREPAPNLVTAITGNPGLWKEIDAEPAEVHTTSLSYLTHIVEPSNHQGLISCEVFPDERLPIEFSGVSGSPLFSANREFLGINDSEMNGANRSLHAIPAHKMNGLWNVQTERTPARVWSHIRVCEIALDGVYRPSGSAHRNVKLKSLVEFQWAVDQSAQPANSSGEVRALWILTPSDGISYPINFGRKFLFDPATTPEELTETVLNEVSILFGRCQIDTLVDSYKIFVLNESRIHPSQR